jgi:predicted nucleic acid-binding protein
MNILIDSSIWIEYFSGGSKAKGLEKIFRPPNKIILPSVVTYEVYKKIQAEKGEAFAVLLLAQMERLSSSIIPINQALAVQAADISLRHKIPMADSMIYSVALFSESTVITMDSHFKGLPACQLV